MDGNTQVSKLLCAAPHCRMPGHHGADCKAEPDKPCRGCIPAIAADGLLLCRRDEDYLGHNAIEAALLWTELELQLTASSGLGDGIRTRQAQPGLNLNELVLDHRATIRHTLVAICRMISEERGHALPADRIGPIAFYVANASRWLAGHEAAGEIAGELRALVAKGRTLRQVSGTRVVPIGSCPRSQEDHRCPGTLRALLRREASLLPSAVTCDADETHSWDSTQWTKLGRAMRSVA